MDAARVSTSFDSTMEQYLVDSLMCCSNYSYEVVARNAAGDGTSSMSLRFRTNAQYEGKWSSGWFEKGNDGRMKGGREVEMGRGIGGGGREAGGREGGRVGREEGGRETRGMLFFTLYRSVQRQYY